MSEPELAWRREFPALERCVHLISHSLGCMPARAIDGIREFTDLWQERSITAWEAWLPEVDRAGQRIGRIIGAPEGSVIMHTNVSAIQSMLASCFDFDGERRKVVYTALNFPSVSYVWKAEERRGAEISIVDSPDGVTVPTEALLEAIDEKTLVVPISHVLFSSAYIQDARRICQRAREVGAHVILDCYQSIGIVPFDVVDLGVSFACGGSVKYLCGGPGAAWLYVRDDLRSALEPRATGWFGHREPFAFTMPDQAYAETTWRYMGGTPAICALYQARAGHEIIAEVGVESIREKSLRQTQALIERVDDRGFVLRSPRAAEERGGSVVFDFEGAAEVARELNRRRFFCDHRPGAGIRVAPHFYTKDEELALFFEEIAKILA